MRPLNFFSIRKDALWGDESWEISAVEGSESVLYVESPQERERRLFADKNEDKIQNSDNKGTTLPQLIEQYKGNLVGEKVWNKYGSKFPVLVKFINAKDDLSIQVHPNDDIAKKRGYPNGKTELWYVVDAVGEAYIMDGFKEKMQPEKLRSMVNGDLSSHDPIGRDSAWTALGGTMKSVAEAPGDLYGYKISQSLNWHVAKKGDWYFIPAGRVHSIGSGAYIVEIQQTSGLTYRLFDYNRVDKDGKRRRLDVDEALEALDYSITPFNKDKGNIFEINKANGGKSEIEQLVSCSYFTTSMVNLRCSKDEASMLKGNLKEFNFDFSSLDSFVIFVCTNGAGKICFKDDDVKGAENSGEQCITIKKSDVYLLPACLKSVKIKYDCDLRILETHID
jgi:mannose-6-phosphate isomerase